jgi:uncharacterized protein
MRLPGVVAALLLPLLLAFAVAAAEPRFPALTGRVVDEAGLLSPATRERLTERLAEHERATGEQVVVVTLPSLQSYPIEDFGYRLGRHWGIGEKGKNTGALLIVAPRERAVRIEVGYGLEERLTDASSRAIIEQDILPEFRRGNFEAGILAGTTAMLAVLGGAARAPPAKHPAQEQSPQDILSAIIVMLVIFFFLARLFGRRRAGWVVGPPLGGVWTSRGGWGDRGGGGGGFSGGGGSFGGGGASGRW